MSAFEPRTFFEWVARAAREPVYSAALGWLFSDDSPLPLPQRLNLLAVLAGVDVSDGASVRVVAEWGDRSRKARDRLDLLITVGGGRHGPLHVAIENKIKSAEAPGQLAVYDKQLAGLSGQVAKVFLTLSGDAPASGERWRAVAYAELLAALPKAPTGDPHVEELRMSLSRLVAVASAATSDLTAVADAFGDPQTGPPTALMWYVADMRLQNVVQRVWMKRLAELLEVPPPWRARVDETRGQALIDVEAVLRDEPGYRVGLQVQRRTLKVFCCPEPYPKQASNDQRERVSMILESIRRGLELSPRLKPSGDFHRGFRSFSIGSLPAGRAHAVWREQIAPHLANLVRTFSAVLAVAIDASPVDDDVSA